MFYRTTKPYYNYDKTCNAATKWAVSCPRCLSITVYL